MFKTKNAIKYIIWGSLIITWLFFSFALPYYLITNQYMGWTSFSYSFSKYLIFLQPISTLGIAYILTKGELSKIKNKIRPLLAITVILIVFAFTMIRWTTITTTYCHYGTYCKKAVEPYSQFIIPYDRGGTDFERATLYREALKNKYDIMFKQIWIFGFIMFTGTFLLLYALEKKDEK